MVMLYNPVEYLPPAQPDPVARPRFRTNKLGDIRFRQLIGAQAWNLLPPATRRRFAKRLLPGQAVVYRGHLTALRLGWAGRALGFLLRPFGAPLPLPGTAQTGAPTVVTVTEGADGQTQYWTRLFTAGRGMPQVIRSAKRFRGPTGLEENIGWGITMALAVTVVNQVLTFTGTGYALDLGQLRIPIPTWLTPGELVVTHRDLAETDGDGAFEFGLDVNHPWFGELVHQRALYREVSDVD